MLFARSTDTEKQSAREELHPLHGSFLLTRFMIFWIFPVIKIAQKRQLNDSDIWDMPRKTNVGSGHKNFQKFWEEEKTRSKHHQDIKEPSLFQSIVNCYWRGFLASGLAQISFMVFQIAQPFFVAELVKYIASGDGGLGWGLGLACMLGFVSLCSSVSISIVFYVLRTVGIQIRAAMMMAVYDQSLKITSSAKQSHSVGQITNLAAIDAEKIFLAAHFPHFLWQGPVTCLVVMGILISEVGAIPALAGFAVFVVMVPMQNYIAGTIGETRRRMVKFTDERVKLVNEILQAIRIIKLYAWEVPMEERVEAARETELGTLITYLNRNGLLREFLFVGQPLAALVIYLLSLYVYNRPLSQVQVIRVISFLNITILPLNLLGVAMKTFKDGAVSLSRFQRYLLLPTLASLQNEEESNQLVARPHIRIRNAVFSWEEPVQSLPDGSSSIRSIRSIRSNNSRASADKEHQPQQSKESNVASRNTASASYELVQYTEIDDAGDGKEGDNSSKDSPAAAAPSPFAYSLRVPDFATTANNELVAVVGSVGSGKSSLISSLLGEMPLRGIIHDNASSNSSNSSGGGGAIDGMTLVGASLSLDELKNHVDIHGPISYCAQTPWIQNMSLRNNVLFGGDGFDDVDDEEAMRQSSAYRKYENALSAAALATDLKILPDGDRTEIGERGINLSGGQKARVSLARAFMASSRSQIYLFDDPFSAVDGATGNWIFEHGVLKLLHDKIRIVALNSHLHLLKSFHRILVLEQGKVVADGSPIDLAQTKPELMTRVTGLAPEELCGAACQEEENASAGATITIAIETTAALTATQPAAVTAAVALGNTSSDGSRSTNGGAEQVDKTNGTQQAASTSISPSSEQISVAMNSQNNSVTALVEKERAAVGSVGYGVYVRYFSASLDPKGVHKKLQFYAGDQQQQALDLTSWTRYAYGSLIVLMLLVIFVVCQTARVAVDFYLIRWAASGGDKNSSWGTAYYIAIGVAGVTICIRAIALNYFAVRSSRNVHASMLRSVLSASVPQFFDTHTIGEVLNRFAKDCETVDVNIPEFMLQMLQNWLRVLSVFALCIFASPWFVLILVPLGVGFVYMYKFFEACSRDLKKLESVSRSPIFAALSETLTGLETIRAYGDSPRFLKIFQSRMERNHKLFYHLWMSMSWVTARLEIGSTVVAFAVALLAVSLRQSVSPIALGLALAYALQLTALFQRSVQLSIDVTTYMTSTERMCEYLNITHEASTTSGPSDSAAPIPSTPNSDPHPPAAAAASGGGAVSTSSRKSSHSARVGHAGMAPSRETANAPAAAASRRASRGERPSTQRATANAARNASPAPVSSTHGRDGLDSAGWIIISRPAELTAANCCTASFSALGSA
mmetsp:Transcript_9429/g.15612  ORF Transcript_9429/g.15612 Transcript_9429/m.15612 type:complete len:1368 (+) Transcript_9429:191-4294(+)